MPVPTAEPLIHAIGPGTWQLYRVTVVRATGPTSLHVAFADGMEGDVELRGWLPAVGGFAQLLADPELFAQVALDPETHCIGWPNQVDLDTEALRARMVA